MKKPQLALLFATIIFCAVVLGVYIGRNHTGNYISVSDGARNTEISGTVSAASSENAQVSDGKININTATKAQLMLLPGIGETLAQRILDYRLSNGAFSSTDDLLLVEGIGQVKLANIEQYITVGG